MYPHLFKEEFGSVLYYDTLLACRSMLIMSLLVLGIGLIQDVVNLLMDVLDVLNKLGFFIILELYMCGFFLCSRMRHGNINRTQWLKSQTHLKGIATSRAIESYVVIVLHIGKTLILGSWMLGFVQAKYVHYHPIDDLPMVMILEMEGSRLGELGVQ